MQLPQSKQVRIVSVVVPRYPSACRWISVAKFFVPIRLDILRPDFARVGCSLSTVDFHLS